MIIGLGHVAQVGKDTVGKILVEQHGFTRVAFADDVKAMALDIDPLIPVARWGRTDLVRLSEFVAEVGWEEAKKQHEVRRFLKRLGTEGIRTRVPDFWVDRAFDQMHLLRRVGVGDIVLTDVRFKNEAMAIKDAHGFVIDVRRPGVVAADDHPSEHELDDWPFDLTLNHSGSLEKLERKVRLMVPLLGRRAEAA